MSLKKIIPISASITTFIIIIFLWDKIKIPYDETNLIYGEYYEKKINPWNDTIKFLLIIGIPSLTYLFFYLKLDKHTFSLKKNNNFFLVKENIFTKYSLKIFILFFFIIILAEFLSLNFQSFIDNIDVFHEGTYLVPPMNYLKTNDLFNSTLYDYGLIANNLGYIYYKIFGYYNPGSIIIIKLTLIFLIKISLILISAKLIENLYFENFFKIIFFIILTFILINLPDYHDLYSYFSPRLFLYTFFIYFLGNELTKFKSLNPRFVIIGCFSIVSIMWWWDVGAYLNAILILLLIYFIYDKQFKNFALVLTGILIPWLIFYFYISDENFSNFIYQLKFPYSKYWDYLLGIEYKKPFSNNSGRWTKSILIIYFSVIFLINFNFSKNYKINSSTKIFLNLLFISSIIIFKSALMRSDSYHLKYISGLYSLIFIYLFIFNVIYLINNNEKLRNYFLILKQKKLLIYLVIFVSIFFNQIYKNDKNENVFKNFSNILQFKKNISLLVNAEPFNFLSKKKIEVIKYYKQITEKDTCLQIMTDDVSFSYFLEKKTCTQFYIPSQIINGFTEKKFLEELTRNSPEIILFESNYNILLKKNNMPNAFNFIKKNYSYYSNLYDYIFYKKN